MTERAGECENYSVMIGRGYGGDKQEILCGEGENKAIRQEQ